MYMCVCVCASLCLLCGAVSRRVSRVVARYVLFVVRDLSLVVDCLSLRCALWFCVVACCCCCRCGLFLVIGVSAYTVSVAPCAVLLAGCLQDQVGTLGGPLGQVITLCGQILVSRTDDDPLSPARVSVQNVPMCTFKTSPCVPAPRPHVETHVRVVPA